MPIAMLTINGDTEQWHQMILVPINIRIMLSVTYRDFRPKIVVSCLIGKDKLHTLSDLGGHKTLTARQTTPLRQ